MKPICVACQRFYRPKKNGTAFLEMMPKGEAVIGRQSRPGRKDPEAWQPYKVWMGDLWKCGGCGHELIVGVSHLPLAEQHQTNFDAVCRDFQAARYVVNDC